MNQSSPSSGGGGAANHGGGGSGGGGGGSSSASNGAPESRQNGNSDAVSATFATTTVTSVAPPAAPSSTSAGLKLTDASGAPVQLTLDENTIVIGAATWCGYCAQLKAQLNTPQAQGSLAGLRIVFAFGNEGGSGAGGVLDSEFLADLPGELTFLAADSVQPQSFPSAFNSGTGQFDQDPTAAIQSWWLNKNGLEAPAATNATSTGLALVDAAGAALNITPDANTLIVGAATWCGATAKFKEALSKPEIAEQLTGLRIVFAFDNEGGAGPGGVVNAEFLADTPGEVAFLAPGSVRPERLPMAYSAATGQFDLTAVDALNAWASGTLVTGGTCGNKNAAAADASRTSASSVESRDAATVGESLRDSQGGAGGSALTGDYNSDNAVDAADYVTWRKMLNLTGANLPADGDGDMDVDEFDYGIWQTHFGDELSVPGAFTITGPVGVQTDEQRIVTWTASANATSYQYVVSQQTDLSFPIYYETVTTNSQSVNLGNGTFYVGVTAINADGSTVADNQGFSIEVQLPPTDQLLFVSFERFYISATNTYPPVPNSFGSALAADFHCTKLASSAGLLEEQWDLQTIHFRALLSQETTGIVNRAGMINDTYYNTAGQVIASNLTDLMAGSWTDPVLTQVATALTGIQGVWTGTLSDGRSSPTKCNNWSNPTGGVANAGNVNGVGTQWLNQGSLNCAVQSRLYCVGKRNPT